MASPTYTPNHSQKQTAKETLQSGGAMGVEFSKISLENGGEAVKGKVNWQGKPAIKGRHGGLGTSVIILVAFGFMSTATYAYSVNLVSYLTGVMHFSIANASIAVTNFIGTSFAFAFGMAYLADTYIGRCRTLSLSYGIILLGLILSTFQAHVPSLKPPPCNIYDETTQCEKVDGGNAALLYIALYLTAIGLAGAKSTTSAQGADQFDQTDPVEALKISSFFNWYLMAECLGAGVSLSLIIWIQNNIGWDWGNASSSIAMLTCVIIFFAGFPRYRIHVNRRTDGLLEIIQVFVAAFRNRKLDLPQNIEELYEMDKGKECSTEVEFLPHRDTLRCLDKASIQTSSPPSPWKLCRVTQVENAKKIIATLPIFCCTIVMSTGQAQLVSFSIYQGMTLDSRIIGHVKISPASLPIIPIIFLIVLVPIYDQIFVPFARKITGHPRGITYFQRIGIGLLLSSMAMAGAGILEVKRKETAERLHMLDAMPGVQPLPISVLWLSFQYFIYGICDMFTNVGLLEFFYAEAPKSLKSIATSFLWLSIGLGYFLSGLLVKLVNAVTSGEKGPGWLEGNNLNRQHLDRFYWLISILTVINFLVYLFCAMRYKYASTTNSSPVN